MKDVIESLSRIEANVTELVKRKDDHETRLRSLEKWRWLIVGAAGVIVFAIELLPKLIK